MNDKRHPGVMALLIGAVLAGYFGAYFVAAEYIDVGDNRPMYLVQYSIGPVRLHGFAFFFEPARRIDDLCFRHKRGFVVD